MTAATTSTRERALHAALQVFARFGYRKTSMEQVARAAALSRQGLYLLFQNKELLFRATVAFGVERRLAAARAAACGDADVAQRLRDTMFAWHRDLVGLEELDELGKAMLEQAAALHEEGERAFGELLAGLFAELGARGEARAGAELTLLAASRGLVRRAASVDAFAEQLGVVVDVVVRSVAAGERGAR